MARKHVGLYPGTFDPVTVGHLDIISRATRIVDHLIVGVAVNAGKGPMFTLEERVGMVRESLEEFGTRAVARIEVMPFETLLVNFVKEMEASVIIRGLRAVSDFEYEFQMAGMNARLDNTVETVFLMASERSHFISSRFVKEIGRLGGDISTFVTPSVHDRLLRRFAEEG
ncbi:pantetheine-phosphate adenylyltransferase [Roseospira marina]|uniref:Phosphopantetheine adenylyltransferase n=1 Tax=Roseospira marina TaxID=140057 RepID=A0A5M6IA48_9PROT|nr:pantetheine-phosphate adenylyltransferase [Roseospira marina]KAA5604605.1 pantetheine-phosphate adenylyltransferase [Roseospira marina]MBB4315357.1 pantetheine-phosphate adenylyltransferase [Roseospira marina]MBB5088356.1 pantetheine-phosphate adenylyltransferase [Roseospira marina]